MSKKRTIRGLFYFSFNKKKTIKGVTIKFSNLLEKFFNLLDNLFSSHQFTHHSRGALFKVKQKNKKTVHTL